MNWENWLREIVTWGLTEEIPRHVAIRRLCKYGLIPFLNSHGYVLGINHIQLGSRIATGLYKNINKNGADSNWSFGLVINNRMCEEYEDQYRSIIDQDAWDAFWETWGCWSDFDPDTHYGWDRQMDVQYDIWSQIHAEGSKHTAAIDEMFRNEYETEHDSRDSYLKDVAESNEWGGYRK
jgi:hypothetical protein